MTELDETQASSEAMGSVVALVGADAGPPDGEADHLDRAVRTVGEVRAMLLWFAEQVAAAAKRTIGHVRLVLWGNALAALIVVAYAAVQGSYAWVWCATLLVMVVVPAAVVWVGHLILSETVSLPERVGHLSDEMIEALQAFWPKITALPADGWGVMTRWRSYALLGRILWRLYSIQGKAEGVGQSE